VIQSLPRLDAGFGRPSIHELDVSGELGPQPIEGLLPPGATL
jgi:hypothetical protein